MHMLKLLFQKLQIRPDTPRRDSGPPVVQLKTTAWGTAGDIPVIVFQGGTDPTCLPWDS